MKISIHSVLLYSQTMEQPDHPHTGRPERLMRTFRLTLTDAPEFVLVICHQGMVSRTHRIKNDNTVYIKNTTKTNETFILLTTSKGDGQGKRCLR